MKNWAAGFAVLMCLQGVMVGAVAYAGSIESDPIDFDPIDFAATIDFIAAAPVAAQAKYDAVFSICESVVPVGHSDFSALNNIPPGTAATLYFQARGITLKKSEPREIILLESPKHGELLPRIEYLGSYMYHPNEGYLGLDQMTFSVKIKGKLLKVIYSVYVNRSSEYIAPECGNNYDIKELPNPTKSTQIGGRPRLRLSLR